jgi:hypothetical protein
MFQPLHIQIWSMSKVALSQWEVPKAMKSRQSRRQTPPGAYTLLFFHYKTLEFRFEIPSTIGKSTNTSGSKIF